MYTIKVNIYTAASSLRVYTAKPHTEWRRKHIYAAPPHTLNPLSNMRVNGIMARGIKCTCLFVSYLVGLVIADETFLPLPKIQVRDAVKQIRAACVTAFDEIKRGKVLAFIAFAIYNIRIYKRNVFSVKMFVFCTNDLMLMFCKTIIMYADKPL